MKVSYNWLKEYLSCDLTAEQLAEAMTSIGIEVDSVEFQEEIPGGLAGVVVAEVLTCIPHPDSDHLHITTVNDGTPEPVTVVCGAPNVAAGQKVLFARIGTVLPGDFKIKKSKRLPRRHHGAPGGGRRRHSRKEIPEPQGGVRDRV